MTPTGGTLGYELGIDCLFVSIKHCCMCADHSVLGVGVREQTYIGLIHVRDLSSYILNAVTSSGYVK